MTKSNRLETMLGERLIIGFEGMSLTAAASELIQRYRPAGVILFRRNLGEPGQIKELIQKIRKVHGQPLWIAVDHEGGQVFRLGDPFTQIPTMADVGNYYAKTQDYRTVESLGSLMGRELRAVGINWNFAPVVDLNLNPDNPIVASRFFGSDAKQVTVCAKAFIKGLHGQKVLSCAKHFPGHGRTTVDSHLDLPKLTVSLKEQESSEIAVYQELMRVRCLPAIMTAHVLFQNLDDQYPATLSEKIMGKYLRSKLKYKGLVLSDDFFMKALAKDYSLASSAERFFKVGGDLALFCHQPEATLAALDELKRLPTSFWSTPRQLIARRRIRTAQRRWLVPTGGGSLKVIGSAIHRKIVDRIRSLDQR